jgi:hypothetical protein
VIYIYPPQDKPIRQGDIFEKIPRASVCLTELPTIVGTEEEVRSTSWISVASQEKQIKAVLPVTPVYAIVATQDCDTSTASEITLCEIRKFIEVEGIARNITSPKKLERIITQHARINQKWFYLPPDPTIGFNEKMGVDFRLTIRVPRADLEGFRKLRKGALNAIAKLHFRERIGQFFSRYAYNEWYPLNYEELQAYQAERDRPVEPKYPWQQSPPPK